MATKNDDSLHALASAYGLERLLEIEPELLARARKEAADLTRRSDRQLKLTDEPVHICRFFPRGA